MGRNISRRKKVYNQEYDMREVDCEVYGCKVRTCNWLRHLGTKEHRDGMGLKTEVVGKIWWPGQGGAPSQETFVSSLLKISPPLWLPA